MSQVLEFHKLILKKEDVGKLSARDKKRLLMLMYMIRELNLYRKMLIYAGNQENNHPELNEAALVTVSFSFIKVLISKVFEIWDFLSDEKIAEEQAAFSADLLKLYSEVESFFAEQKNKELFKFVRNRFGFHFDHTLYLEKFIENAVDEVGDLEFWMGSDNSGNDVFSSANTVILIVFCNKMRELGFTGTEEELIRQMQKLPIQISYVMSEFCKKYLVEVVLKGHIFEEKGTISVNVPQLSEVSLPLIIYNDLGSE